MVAWAGVETTAVRRAKVPARTNLRRVVFTMCFSFEAREALL
jgi:hypothetical protein